MHNQISQCLVLCIGGQFWTCRDSLNQSGSPHSHGIWTVGTGCLDIRIAPNLFLCSQLIQLLWRILLWNIQVQVSKDKFMHCESNGIYLPQHILTCSDLARQKYRYIIYKKWLSFKDKFTKLKRLKLKQINRVKLTCDISIESVHKD